MTAVSPVDDVVELLRELRLPHMRRTAAEVLATAKAPRWDPAEAVRALLAEELAGRQASSVRTRRTAAGFPTGKTFDAWDEQLSSIPAPTQRALRTLEWLDRHENIVVYGPSGTGKRAALRYCCSHHGHAFAPASSLSSATRMHSAWPSSSAACAFGFTATDPSGTAPTRSPAAAATSSASRSDSTTTNARA